MERSELQALVSDLNWLRDHCIEQLEIAEFFENRELMNLNRGAAVAYEEAANRLRDVLQRGKGMDYSLSSQSTSPSVRCLQ